MKDGQIGVDYSAIDTSGLGYQQGDEMLIFPTTDDAVVDWGRFDSGAKKEDIVLSAAEKAEVEKFFSSATTISTIPQIPVISQIPTIPQISVTLVIPALPVNQSDPVNSSAPIDSADPWNPMALVNPMNAAIIKDYSQMDNLLEGNFNSNSNPELTTQPSLPIAVQQENQATNFPLTHQFPAIQVKTLRRNLRNMHDTDSPRSSNMTETNDDNQTEDLDARYLDLMQAYRTALLQLRENIESYELFEQVNKFVKVMVSHSAEDIGFRLLPQSVARICADNKSILQLLVLDHFGYFKRDLLTPIAWSLAIPQQTLKDCIQNAKKQLPNFSIKIMSGNEIASTNNFDGLNEAAAKLEKFPPQSPCDAFIARNKLLDLSDETRSVRKKYKVTKN